MFKIFKCFINVFVKVNPCKVKTGYRNYTKENLEESISLVEKGISVYKALKLTGVPQTTIKDRRKLWKNTSKIFVKF